MKIMKPADGDARVQVGSHERSGQNRCDSRKRS